MFKVLLMLVPFSIAAPADAAGPAFSNADFLEGCQSALPATTHLPNLTRRQELAATFCIAYVAGFMEGAAVKQHYPSRLCFPLDLKRNEGFRVVVEQMRAPAAASHGHGEITLAAVARAFPCPGGR